MNYQQTLQRLTLKQIQLATYLSDYIHEELVRGLQPEDITTWMFLEAFEAFEGGAAIITTGEES